MYFWRLFDKLLTSPLLRFTLSASAMLFRASCTLARSATSLFLRAELRKRAYSASGKGYRKVADTVREIMNARIVILISEAMDDKRMEGTEIFVFFFVLELAVLEFVWVFYIYVIKEIWYVYTFGNFIYSFLIYSILILVTTLLLMTFRREIGLTLTNR